jgi:hypothetical protein
MTTDNNHNDLHWLAFSYVAGELTPAEAEQFELRLADDQTAREALARAVELCQVVTAVEAHSDSYVAPAAKTRSTWNDRLSWMAIGGLASLLIALLWTGVVGPTWHTAKIHSFARKNLAFAWAETNQQIANVREAGSWPTVPAYLDEDGAAVTTMDDTNDEAPSWMTAAVLSISADDSSGAPSQADQVQDNNSGNI